MPKVRNKSETGKTVTDATKKDKKINGEKKIKAKEK